MCDVILSSSKSIRKNNNNIIKDTPRHQPPRQRSLHRVVVIVKSLERRTEPQLNEIESRMRTGLARHDMSLSTVIGKLCHP
ncbi:MAG: hypothetical protein WA364_20145 [Candidatus Nitrosopolaris sp.]